MKKVIDDFHGDNFFLSNFFPSKVTLDGVTYGSVEHAYVAAKTLDKSVRERILKCETPGQAKRLGRSIEIRPDWNNVRLGVMEKLVREKFAKPHLKKMLLETSGYELIEGNWWNDQFWGVCRGKGENHLGKIIMKIRAELEQEE